MSVIVKQLANYQKMDLQAIKRDIVKKNEKLILDTHREQLRTGQSGSGDMPTYFAGYLNYKRSLPSYFSSPKADLFITGKLQKGEFLRIDNDNVEIDSSVDYLTDILDNPRYGEKVLELNKNSYALVQEETTPDYYKEIHKQLNK